jgi:hypothetical protein
VSEVGFGITDFVRCILEIEGSLQQMIRLLEEIRAGQAKMKAAKEEMKSDINARAAALKDQFKEDIKGHMEAWLEEMRSCGKETTICKVVPEVCPEKLKASPEETNRGHEFGG